MNIISLLPSAKATRFVNAICGKCNYQELIDKEPNPESREDFANRKGTELLKNQVENWEKEQAIKNLTLTPFT